MTIATVRRFRLLQCLGEEVEQNGAKNDEVIAQLLHNEHVQGQRRRRG